MIISVYNDKIALFKTRSYFELYTSREVVQCFILIKQFSRGEMFSSSVIVLFLGFDDIITCSS